MWLAEPRPAGSPTNAFRKSSRLLQTLRISNLYWKDFFALSIWKHIIFLGDLGWPWVPLFFLIALAIGVLTSSWGVKVRRFCGFVVGGMVRCRLVRIGVRVRLSHPVCVGVRVRRGVILWCACVGLRFADFREGCHGRCHGRCHLMREQWGIAVLFTNKIALL